MAKKLTYFYLVPLELMLAAAAVFSLCGTTYFELYMQNEVPSYQKDHPLTLLLFLAAAIFLLLRLADSGKAFCYCQRAAMAFLFLGCGPEQLFCADFSVRCGVRQRCDQ